MAGMSETKRKVLDALTLSLITLVCTFAPFFSSAQTTKQNEVHVLAPNGYLSPDVISAFEKSHKAKVSISVYYNDKMMDSLIDGNRGTAFDVLIANEAGAKDAVVSGFAEKRNESVAWHIESGSTLDEYAEYLSFDAYGVAYIDGKSSAPSSWEDFFSLSQRFIGRVSIPDDYQVLMTLSLLANNPNGKTISLSELNNAGRTFLRFLKRIKPDFFEFSPENLSENGSVYALVTASEEERMKRENSKIRFVYPGNISKKKKQFAILSVLAKTKDSAKAFIEYLSTSQAKYSQGSYHLKAIPSANSFMIEKYKKSYSNVDWDVIYGNMETQFTSFSESNTQIEMRKAYLYERILDAARN